VSEIELSAFDFETERLHLRLLVEGDEALFHGLYTDPETMRFIGPPLSAEKAAKSFQKFITRQREPSLKGRLLVMLEKATLQPVGICGTSQRDGDALRLEVGIILKREARSRGFARETLTALIKRIFALSPIEEIYVRFSAQCPAVERLNIRVGFVPCANEITEDGLWSKRVWSVHRSSWCTDQATNLTNCQENTDVERDRLSRKDGSGRAVASRLPE
jgi:RimJ/RimL family protein N-acetyltransferase